MSIMPFFLLIFMKLLKTALFLQPQEIQNSFHSCMSSGLGAISPRAYNILKKNC